MYKFHNVCVIQFVRKILRTHHVLIINFTKNSEKIYRTMFAGLVINMNISGIIIKSYFSIVSIVA